MNNNHPMAIFGEVLAEVERARAKFPRWESDMVHSAAVVMEEAGEFLKEVNSHYWHPGMVSTETIRTELIQTMAMCVRFLQETPAMQQGDAIERIKEQPNG